MSSSHLVKRKRNDEMEVEVGKKIESSAKTTYTHNHMRQLIKHDDHRDTLRILLKAFIMIEHFMMVHCHSLPHY